MTPEEILRPLFYLRVPEAVHPSGEGIWNTAPGNAVDADLCRRACRGDPEAQEILARQLAPRLLRVARRLGCDEQEAEDSVQETLYRGIAKLSGLKAPEAISAWFAKILVNRLRDVHRRARISTCSLTDAPEPHTAAADGPEAQVDAADLQERVARAMKQLPPKQRLTLALHSDAGLGVSEIAEVLGDTTARVKANLWHARRRLRGLLSDVLGETSRGDKK